MPKVVIKIVSDYGKVAGHLYGPYESEEIAVGQLRQQGWSENVNGILGLWCVQNERYQCINARIEPLHDCVNLPQFVCLKKQVAKEEKAHVAFDEKGPGIHMVL